MNFLDVNNSFIWGLHFLLKPEGSDTVATNKIDIVLRK